MLEVPFSLVKKFLDEYAEYRGVYRQRHTWKADDGTVISFRDFENLDYFRLEAIASEQLEIGILELDYWLGENGFY